MNTGSPAQDDRRLVNADKPAGDPNCYCTKLMSNAASSSVDLPKPDHLFLAAPTAQNYAAGPRMKSSGSASAPLNPGKARPSKRGSAKPPHSPADLPSSHSLQNGVLLVLALYASMALLNLGEAWSAFGRGWQQFIEFIVSGLF